MTGDSTARYMFPNLIGLFSGWKCLEVRRSDAPVTDDVTPLTKHTDGSNVTLAPRIDVSRYFITPNMPNEMIQSSPLRASIEVSRQFQCVLNKETVHIEYISMTRLIHDNGLMIVKHNISKGTLDAANKMEFLLKYYFPYHGFPDLWLFKLPFRHEAWWTPDRSKLAIDARYMMQVLGLYLPRTSRLLFLSDSRECTDKLPAHILASWSAVQKETRQTTRQTTFHAYNQIFYEVFGELRDRLPNLYAFLDEMRLSCSMMCDFHRDAGHYVDAYYTSISRYAMESVCASPWSPHEKQWYKLSIKRDITNNTTFGEC